MSGDDDDDDDDVVVVVDVVAIDDGGDGNPERNEPARKGSRSSTLRPYGGRL
ncbi:hypothetical protein TWF694_002817 [Orbilia ellipsospora]|uniref:Uncharacterized protein n=1 Tax=Orbilia ellipsospora TaxID=2528407 RepID=A0AAV9X5R9_9PEZI